MRGRPLVVTALGACRGDHSVKALEPAVLGWGTLQRQRLHAEVCTIRLSAPKIVRKCDGEAVPPITESKVEFLARVLMGNV